MKILWVKTDFLHPTTRGGQIRTLETLRRLHARHEVHYLALTEELDSEGVRRAGEYSSFAYPVLHQVTDKRSAGFVLELLKGLVSELPVAVFRWQSAAMRAKAAELCAKHKFDSIVCDFLFPAPNLPDLGACVLFQHNVEARIWERHAQQGSTPLHKAYFGLQASRMAAYEQKVCQASRRVIAVSEDDAVYMRQQYQTKLVDPVPTGVDTVFFAPPDPAPKQKHDLVFLGSMDWMPNIEGVEWFTDAILPLIRRELPECSLAVVGRKPAPSIEAIGKRVPGVTITGTVPDVRPWLHESRVAIVPLRIGGGTRLKIYEAMAARVPVVSTTIGAEGLEYRDGETIAIADKPDEFAARCVALLRDGEKARRQAKTAFDLVESRYSWEAVTDDFERLLIH